MSATRKSTKARSKGRTQVGCLWIGGSLSFLEQLCLTSMRKNRCDVTLFTYGKVEGVPKGIAVEDAADIMPWNEDLVHRMTGSPALMSDLFRYHLLRKRPGILWSDTDIVFLGQPPTQTHVYGYESQRTVNGALAAIPHDAPALTALLRFTENQHPVPPWAPPKQRFQIRANPVHVADLPWGVWGPGAFTYFLKTCGGIEHAASQASYHPVRFKDVRDLIIPGREFKRWFTDETRTVHLYGRAMRRIIIQRFGGLPPENSFVGQQVEKYGIDPAAAPLVAKK